MVDEEVVVVQKRGRKFARIVSNQWPIEIEQ